MPDVQSMKKHIKMQQWTAIIKDRIASGLKIDEYCDKNQLSRNAYFVTVQTHLFLSAKAKS